LSTVNAAGARRPARVRIRRRRPAAPPARLTRLDARAARYRRVARRSAVSIRERTRPRTRDTGYRLPPGVDLVRVLILLVLAVLAVVVVLPALLGFAAAPFR
jgi:hypothetical protein